MSSHTACYAAEGRNGAQIGISIPRTSVDTALNLNSGRTEREVHLSRSGQAPALEKVKCTLYKCRTFFKADNGRGTSRFSRRPLA